ncbi:DUF456 domain-containing protein [Nocardioides sp.]|uniref:DUF456 domain-containing protein n=1 Tax=Nocardioides sp. TaxID=35761 RepID=UPI0031FE4BAF|nr:hypothetical protein [Nocardioides sp.]
MSLTEVVVALAIAVGLAGILVPVLPGSMLVLAAILWWAVQAGGGVAWAVFVVASAFLVVGTVVKYAVPNRRLTDAGIPSSTQWLGAAAGIVGFFVVPVVGVFLGFMVGVYLAERHRVGARAAWPSTKAALGAVGLSILIELAAALLATATWVVGVVAA